MHKAIVIASLAGLAAAQLGGLSANCTQAASTLLSGDLASCANLISLVGLATVSGSIVPAVDNYVRTLCAQAPCSSSTISSARSTVTAACQSDIQSGNAIVVALTAILNDYTDTRGLFCSQQTSNSSYCLPQTLYNIQNATGQSISIDYLTSLVSSNGLVTLLDSVPNGAVCTDCGKAIVVEAGRVVGSNSTSAQSTVNSAAASKCGSSFGDGQIPASISTSGSAASGSSGAAAGATAFSLGPIAAIAAAAVAALAGSLVVLA